MKKAILVTTLLIICNGLAAQPPMGGMGGGRPPGGRGGEGRPPMHEKGGQNQDFFIMGMPDIPDLTLEQREKLSKAISDEQKDISKLMQEKQDIKMKADNPGISEKERVKLIGKAEKTDEKIRKKQEKYDDKYKSILSAEQYQIFSEKKKDIEFRGPRNGTEGRRPDRGKGEHQLPPQMPEGEPALEMPDNEMF